MQLDDETLQRYYDGELSPVEERAVRARVESDPAAQKRLAQLARLSELFRTAAEEMGQGIDSASLFAGIEADLQKQKELGFGERVRVIAGEWSEHRRTVLVPLVAAGAIAAAALLAFLAAKPQTQPVASTKPAAEPAQEVTLASAPVHGSRVENVDFGANTGTVFEIESQGVSTAVVWIADDEDSP